MGKSDDPQIKIPKGTTIKYFGHPVRLKYALYVKETDHGFVLEDHDVLIVPQVDEEDE